DHVEKLRDARIVLGDLDADALELGEHVGAAALIGNEELAAIADAVRRYVLIGRRILDDRRGVDAGLGGKRALADIGRVAVGSTIEDFIERARNMREVLELLVADADVEALGIFALELQRR